MEQQVTPELKRERLKKAREYHQPTFNTLGASNAYFLLKTDFPLPNNPNESCVGVFTSEMNMGQDIYFEFAHRDNLLKYEERALYRWRWNPHYEEEYVNTDKEGENTSTRRYLIPVSELEVITPQQKKEELKEEKKENLISTTNVGKPEKAPEFILSNESLDLPIADMTIRDYAAIMLKKPCSQKQWLNELISS